LQQRLAEEDDTELLARVLVQAAQLGGPTGADDDAAAVGYPLGIGNADGVIFGVGRRVTLMDSRAGS
jgi:hypothetical protein